MNYTNFLDGIFKISIYENWLFSRNVVPLHSTSESLICKMNDDITTEIMSGDEEVGSYCWVAAEQVTKNLDTLLEDLLYTKGAGFVWTLKEITLHSEFRLLQGETNIFAVGGENSEDYDNLLNAARKAVEMGCCVYILPNPKGIRTADFIFERKGIYRLYDLKTIQGKGSAGTRMKESIGQANRVLLNMTSGYNARLLASDIKEYFEKNPDAVEVLIFKGKKVISVVREHTQSPIFNRSFRRKFEK